MNLKNLFITLLLTLVLGFYCTDTHAQSNSLKINKIILDAGHGGKDPGAVGKFSKEKDLNLKICKRVGKKIKDYYPDVEVFYTRETDVFVKLHERANKANQKEVDLFISVHINANDNKKAYGTETFVMGLSKSSANMNVAKLENSAILHEDDYEENCEGFDLNSPESNIMFSLYQNAYLDQSLFLSQQIQGNFKNSALRHDRGVKQAAFLVLWRTSMPSVLIEAGFISNPEEEKYLNSELGLDQLSTSIFNAFKSYKEHFEGETSNIENYTEPQENTNQAPEQDNNTNTTNNTDTEQNIEGCFFAIQIHTSSNLLDNNNEFFDKYPNAKVYNHNGTYKYYVKPHSNYEEIVTEFASFKINNPGCFIIALNNGKRISISKAKELTKN